MAEPFLGQIQLFGFNFPPRGWALCGGQTLPLSQSTALYSLLGTTFGGDGRTTFMLPNLASNQACGTGQGPGLTPRTLGETMGEFAVTLLNAEIPMHNHGGNIYIGSTSPTEVPTSQSALGTSSGPTFLTKTITSALMSPMEVTVTGDGLPHNNVQPFLGLNFSISLDGDYPTFP